VKPHGRVTGVFGNDGRAPLPSIPAEAAFARAYNTIPLRVLHVEVRGTKGDGDGHPSLR
jgi:hypothetical protein